MSWRSIAQRLKQHNYALKHRLWPDWQAPKQQYRELAEAEARPGARILHAGGGRNKHGLFHGQRVQRFNVDLDHATLAQDQQAALRVLGNLEQLPVRDNTVDLIVCEMVFEHVAHPAGLLQELFRCLREDGKIIFITPNLFAYPFLISKLTPFWFHRLYGFLRGRHEQDVFPTHYRLNTPAALSRHFGDAGFELVQLRQYDSSCDYFDVFPGLYVLMAALSRCLNRFHALRMLRQFHIGCFCKPARPHGKKLRPATREQVAA